MTMGLGLAAANTGNNLLYLLVATLLGLIVASGVLSEQSMRGLKLARVIPGEIFAGQAALVGLVLTNTKRWLSTHSVAVESLGISGAGGRYVSRLEPGQEALLTVEERFPRRGRHQLPRIRVVTRFPFGLFLKMSHPLPSQEVLVYPAVRPLAPESLRGIESGWAEPERRAGQGAELHNLRDYQWGDDPRLIHWKSSAKAETLVIRELEAETARAVRLVLEPGHGRSAPDLLEAALSWAASLASHLIGEGARVELVGPGVHVPLGPGPVHLRRILEALALFDPDGENPDSCPPAAGGAVAGPVVRVIRIPLGAEGPR